MATPELQIRPIEPADVPALLTIIAASRREYGLAERGVELLDAADRELYATYQRQRTLYFVAVRGGEVVGGAGVAPLSAADPLTCELQRMYVRADARGHGIGDALLKRCLAAAKQFLYVRCYLETIHQMEPAIAFYDRHGFISLQGPMGRSRPHSDRWMVRPLRASARLSAY
ncbi:MAG: acetyltransferase [Steroidobacteraceae bacterium]|jgi:putative acetyltransferase|nr:acetyltransferase [Steroidobacteraceae bacterium]